MQGCGPNRGRCGRHETRNPLRSNAMKPGFHGVGRDVLRGVAWTRHARRMNGRLGLRAKTRGGKATWPLRTLAVAKHARRGRPAGSEPVQWPGLPRDETRTFTLTGSQPPKRTPVTPKDADRYLDGCFW